MDAQGRLLAPGSSAESGKVVGQANRDGSVTLTPDLTASRAHRGIGQADPGGAGNKPPPNVGSVRPDGERDENANVGATSARARLPRNGHWTDPTKPGNSGWMSNDPQVNAITGGQPIQFVNGRPDLTPWSKMSVNFQPGDRLVPHVGSASDLRYQSSQRGTP